VTPAHCRRIEFVPISSLLVQSINWVTMPYMGTYTLRPLAKHLALESRAAVSFNLREGGIAAG
jgi:hypothetical protein